jgi:exodeoxyribonuclease X
MRGIRNKATLMIATIVDIETTGEAPPEKIVEIAAVDVDGEAVRVRGTSLVCPATPIPPEASAVHHLVDADVKYAPSIGVAVLNVLGEPYSARLLVAHNAKFERLWLDAIYGEAHWICTMKSAMRVWPQAGKFSNQFLRYWLGLSLGDVASPPHRALPDCIVTAHIFVRLLKESSIEQMIEWTMEPAAWPAFPFGKHRGAAWSAIPLDYFSWILSQPDMDEDIKWNVRREIKRREDEHREVYTSAACAAVAQCLNEADLKAWFLDESGSRISHRIRAGTAEYDRIVKACADRKALLMETPS